MRNKLKNLQFLICLFITINCAFSQKGKPASEADFYQIRTIPVSEGIESLLQWLPEKKAEWEKSISISIDDPLITRLNYNAFKQPIK